METHNTQNGVKKRSGNALSMYVNGKWCEMWESYCDMSQLSVYIFLQSTNKSFRENSPQLSAGTAWAWAGLWQPKQKYKIKT